MNLLKENYELMMEDIVANIPLSNENAIVIIRKYDSNYRSKADSNKAQLFEQYINMNHPALNYQY